MQSASSKTSRKSGYYIGVTCPGCGADLELDSDFFVLDCQFCGSVHRIETPEAPSSYLVPSEISWREARFGIDRHLRKAGLPLTGSGLQFKRMYYPYWKIDAILFRVRNKVIERLVHEDAQAENDVSFEVEQVEISLSPYSTAIAAGISVEGLPTTVGSRAEYVKMYPFSSERVQDDFDTLPVTVPWDEVREGLKKRTEALGMIQVADFGKNHTELFHPRASLVYFPYLVVESYPGKDYNRFIVDGVTGRVLNHLIQPPTGGIISGPDTPEFEPGQLSIVQHRCDTCGIDLPKNQSYVYLCRNCGEMTVLGNSRSMMTSIRCAGNDCEKAEALFPFWSFQILPDQGQKLRRYFGGIYDSDRLVIPAFRMRNFEALYRLTRRLSTAATQLGSHEVVKLDDRFQPVNISADEAVTLANIVIYREEYVRGIAPGSVEAAASIQEAELLYLPVTAQSYFFVDTVLNAVTFEKNAIDD